MTVQVQERLKRMTLASIRRGKIDHAIRVLLWGAEGIGKSTFGAHAPDAIFLGPDNGTLQLDVARFPEPQSWVDFFDAVSTLRHDQHPHKTLVIDTLDWVEPFVWQHVCDVERKKSIEDFGFGKGYVAALAEWRKFLHALEGVWRDRQMNVVLLAHAYIKTFKNPEGDDYDRWNLKLHEKSAGLLKEWVDCVLFAQYETHVLKEDKKATKAKAYGDSTRVIHTQRRAAFDAKNRYGLPETLPLDWDEFAAAVQSAGSVESVATLRARFEALLPQLPADKSAAGLTWLATDKAQSADHLRVMINKTTELISQQQQAQTKEVSQ